MLDRWREVGAALVRPELCVEVKADICEVVLL